MIHVGREGTDQLFCIQQGIDAELSAEQFVTALHIKLNTSVTHHSQSSHITHVPHAGLQLVDVDSRYDIGLGREQVYTMTAEHHTDIDIIQRTVRHEVVYIHVFYIDAGTIAHVVGIEVAVKCQHTTAFTGFDIGGIMGTVHLHATLCRHRWQPVVALDVAGQHGHHETKVLGTGLELHVGTQALHVSHIGHETVGMGTESGRQVNIQVLELHKVHITFQSTLDTQRIVRPTIAHTLWQVTHKAHQVLTTHLGIDTQAELAGIDGIHQRQGHIHLYIDVTFGCLQTELGQSDATVLHDYRTTEVCHLQTTLLLQRQMTHMQAKRGVMIIDGIDADIQMRQVDMIEVEAVNTRLEVLVIGHGTIHQVHTTHGIGFCAQINKGFPGCQCTHVGFDAHGVTGHVQRQV